MSLVVSWFGTDLRAGNCQIKPGVESATKTTTPMVWRVNGLMRTSAHVVSTVDGGPAYGGTPSDAAVVQAIQELKARGKRVTFYPFIPMDIPAANTLPNPYSPNGTTPGQPVYPWRGRITCAPAAGFAGTVDKTATAASQVASFFGSAAPGQFSVSGTTVSFTGSPSDWGLRRMILHYALLCAAAGGVDAFLIGTEMRGLTQIRSGASTYPAVTAFVQLAADVSAILGPGTKVSYAADWSEYFGHQPADGSGDVFFHLDPIWASVNVDFVAIDNYLPLSDWRDGDDHLDALPGGKAHSRPPICKPTLWAAKASTGSTPPRQTAWRKSAPRSPMGPENPGCLGRKTCATGGASRISIAPAASKAAGPPLGCPDQSRSVSPKQARLASIAAPTSPMSSSTRSPQSLCCRIFRAAGPTSSSSAAMPRP